jgi:hypothetical protein
MSGPVHHLTFSNPPSAISHELFAIRFNHLAVTFSTKFRRANLLDSLNANIQNPYASVSRLGNPFNVQIPCGTASTFIDDTQQVKPRLGSLPMQRVATGGSSNEIGVGKPI